MCTAKFGGIAEQCQIAKNAINFTMKLATTKLTTTMAMAMPAQQGVVWQLLTYFGDKVQMQ